MSVPTPHVVSIDSMKGVCPLVCPLSHHPGSDFYILHSQFTLPPSEGGHLGSSCNLCCHWWGWGHTSFYEVWPQLSSFQLKDFSPCQAASIMVLWLGRAGFCWVVFFFFFLQIVGISMLLASLASCLRYSRLRGTQETHHYGALRALVSSTGLPSALHFSVFL